MILPPKLSIEDLWQVHANNLVLLTRTDSAHWTVSCKLVNEFQLKFCKPTRKLNLTLEINETKEVPGIVPKPFILNIESINKHCFLMKSNPPAAVYSASTLSQNVSVIQIWYKNHTHSMNTSSRQMYFFKFCFYFSGPITKKIGKSVFNCCRINERIKFI